METYLQPTEILDWDSTSIRDKAEELIRGKDTELEKAEVLFYFVRDRIPYRLFQGMPNVDFFKASNTLERGQGFCIPKAVLLASLLRAAGIPARLHFADLRNHLLPPGSKEYLKTDLMVYHGYVEASLENNWVKLNPAFNLGLCEKFDIIPVEFSGTRDALFERYNRKGKLHVEYITDHGPFDDLPFERILNAFKTTYPHLARE
jgi:transglutaminase-like putative cysteine protease